ncbi:MAG: NTP transferase domain-containing protein [Elusimicrobia bacterium]|nr:NTP transferase domain-containing protein [Elusimicrobiota bacterium]
MVLAAGEGRRLRPLTEDTPKALMAVGGMPMLELVVRRLVKAGADGIVVNAFHLADQVEAFLKGRDLGVPVSVSREAVLLDTGGGLKQAAPLLDDGKPFFVHNSDVYCELDLAEMYQAHLEGGGLATLAVSDRPTARHLLFDAAGRLCGRHSLKEGFTWAAGPVQTYLRLAFNGIHVISPELLPRMSESGVFPIIQTYLRLAGEGAAIRPFRTDDRYYNDIGDAGKLAEVQHRALEKGLPV